MRLVLLLCLFCGVAYPQPYRWYYTGQMQNEVIVPNPEDPNFGIFKGSVVAFRSLFVDFPVDSDSTSNTLNYTNSTAHWLFNGGNFIKLESVMRNSGEEDVEETMHRMDESLETALRNELPSAASITSMVVSKYELFCSANYAVQEGAKAGPGAPVPNATE
jgi:hypothetical protein